MKIIMSANELEKTLQQLRVGEDRVRVVIKEKGYLKCLYGVYWGQTGLNNRIITLRIPKTGIPILNIPPWDIHIPLEQVVSVSK